MQKNIKTENYYIKENGETRECTKKEYLEHLKYLKEEKIKKLCPNCRVCTCEKIRYSNIFKSEEVEDGTYSRKTYFSADNGNRMAPDIYFDVYRCKKFEPFKEAVYAKLKIEILRLYREILKLEYSISSEYEEKEQEELTNLKRKRNEKLKQIEDKDELSKIATSEKLIKEEFIKRLQLKK